MLKLYLYLHKNQEDFEKIGKAEKRQAHFLIFLIANLTSGSERTIGS